MSCRICSISIGDLLTPCGCNGLNKYVHRECLNRERLLTNINKCCKCDYLYEINSYEDNIINKVFYLINNICMLIIYSLTHISIATFTSILIYGKTVSGYIWFVTIILHIFFIDIMLILYIMMNILIRKALNKVYFCEQLQYELVCNRIILSKYNIVWYLFGYIVYYGLLPFNKYNEMYYIYLNKVKNVTHSIV